MTLASAADSFGNEQRCPPASSFAVRSAPSTAIERPVVVAVFDVDAGRTEHELGALLGQPGVRIDRFGHTTSIAGQRHEPGDPGVYRQERAAAPLPAPVSPASTAVMKGNRKRGHKTRAGPAVRCCMRSACASGSTTRSPLPGGRPVRADVAFPRRGLAVFVDGCFWHACPEHGTAPRSNVTYWTPKLRRNVERDLRGQRPAGPRRLDRPPVLGARGPRRRCARDPQTFRALPTLKSSERASRQ